MAVVPTSLMVGSCCGNKFAVLDDRSSPRSRSDYVNLAQSGLQSLGADSLLVVLKSGKADIRMRIFEKDGSESDSCGNGALLVGSMLNVQQGSVETRGGLLKLMSEKNIRSVTIITPLSMPRFVQGRTDEVSVKVGEPHLVRIVDDVGLADIKSLGKLAQKNYRKGVNLNLIQKVTKSKFLIRTYERGVFAETMSCGTGALAAWLAVTTFYPSVTAPSICFLSAGGSHVVSRSREGLVLAVQKKYIEIARV